MQRPGVANDPLGVIGRTHWDSANRSELDGVVKMVVVMLPKHLLSAA